MRILRVIASMDPAYGGPCQGVRNSIPELAKLGVQNEVVCNDDATAYFIKTDSFVIHGLGRGKGPWGYNAALMPWLLHNILRYDVVIVHGLWQYYSYAVLKAFKKLASAKNPDLPLPSLYVMPHGMLDPYFQQSKSRRLKALRNWFYWKLIENKVISYASGVLFTCQEELRLAKTTFTPYKPKREVNVGYGVVAPLAHNEKMDIALNEVAPQAKHAPYLLFLSRIHPKKGIDILVKAVLQLEMQKVNLPKLIIAGPGLDTKFGKDLKDLATASQNIVFTNMLTGDAKWGAFYNCEAFILPSHQENFGISVVEALACGKPVLTTDKVNIWKEIASSNAGIVSGDSLEGITEVLIKWGSLPAEHKVEMGKNAINCYRHNFDNQSAAKKLLEVVSGVNQ